ncbi:hypothetical protein SAMN04487987_10338 [Algibacter pectinivorans]|uniref:GtrA-like protein n=1 Tax=Algibacter pectinivorans TaxID=870482 RepID=A0A1I1PA08_9FLAO|nr:hypothetical protein SAMN04487987_10338 [Algibacter pectinivorans]
MFRIMLRKSSLKKLFTILNKKLISRYALISIVSYIYVFAGLYLLIDIFEFNKTLAFIIVYGIAYIVLYGVQLKFLYSKSHDNYKLIKYIFSILFFYVSANLLYNLGLFFKLNYIISTALTIMVLMPLRLVVYTFFVYKDR